MRFAQVRISEEVCVRKGFTTGSCAAAAAKAAAWMLLTGREKNTIRILTPKGIWFDADLVDIRRSDKAVSCAVIKDGGDDPDVTTGAHIFANVSMFSEGPGSGAAILIDGGEGVGRVTKPGLDQPVGQAAINHVPREMIRKEVAEVCRVMDFKGTLRVLISVPEGKELAGKTFNPRLGIEGGISILGTTGIVEPMSTKALLDTIRVEIHQKKTLGEPVLAVAPGNYGKEFMKRTYGYDLERSVACSNFIGDALDIGVSLGFEGILLVGHIGKLVKLGAGIMNTHSSAADGRMETLIACGALAGVESAVLRELTDCVTVDAALSILFAHGAAQKALDVLTERIAA